MFKKFLNALAFVTMSGSLTFTSIAEAAVISTFTDRSSWEAAVGAGNFVTEVFDVSSTQPLINNTVNDVGEFNVFYTTADGMDDAVNQIIDVIGGTTNIVDDHLRLNFATEGVNATTALELRFDTPVNAFGTNFGSINQTSGLSLTLDGTTVDLYTALGGSGLFASGFVGWTLDNAVSSAAFSAPGSDSFRMDFVSLGNAAVVPVPAAVWLFGSGFLGLIGLARRKSEKQRGGLV